jgi:hypothetical protein
MIPIINKLIREFAEQKGDMLRNISLSACASQAKFATIYEKFDIDGDYSINIKTTFKPTEEWFKSKVNHYLAQDEKAERDTTKNVTEDDWLYFKHNFETEKSYICNEGFSFNNKPTLDREDNDIGHTRANVKICCCYYNKFKSNNDKK